MDGKTFLLTLVFGHDGVGNLLRHAGNGSHRGHCRSRGADRLAPPEGQGGAGPSSERMTPIRPFPTHRIGGAC